MRSRRRFHWLGRRVVWVVESRAVGSRGAWAFVLARQTRREARNLARTGNSVNRLPKNQYRVRQFAEVVA